MSSQSDDPAKLVVKTLNAVATCKHKGRLQRSSLTIGLAAVTGLLAAIITDWFLVWQSPAARWGAPLLVGVITAIFSYRTYQIFQKGADRQAAAEALDRTQDQSLDRWKTFAALQADGEGATGSDSMAEAMIRDMAPKCKYFDPTTVEPVVIPKKSISLLIGCVVLLLGFLALFYNQDSPRLLARFFAPWAEIPLTTLKDTSTLPKVLLKGSDLDLSAQIGGKHPSTVTLEIDDDQNTETIERTLTATPDKAEFKINNLQETVRYRIRAGDATGEWQSVRVTTRPRLASVSLQVIDPPYSNRAPRVWNRLPTTIRAIKGSRLVLRLESDQPVTSASLKIKSEISRSLAMDVDDHIMSFERELITDFVFHPVFKSTDGFENRHGSSCYVDVVADRPPMIELQDETDRNIISDHEDFKVSFLARDDVGVESAEVVFEMTDKMGNKREVSVPVDLGDQKGKDQIAMETKVDLTQLGLKKDESLAYSVKVQDNSQQDSSTDSKTEETQQLADSMTKRSLKIGGKTAQTKPRPIDVSNKEMLNQVEPKEKKTLAIEAAFAQLKKHTIEAHKKTRAGIAPSPKPGQRLITQPLFNAITDAKREISKANQAVKSISTEASNTPYSFLSMQLQNIVANYIKPADTKLDDAVRNSPAGLPPREFHRRKAENYLTMAISKLNSLDDTIAKVRSEVETEIAMTEMMTMYVAQVEDLPTLLTNGDGTPYQRAPGEVDKAQAEAALAKLDSMKELYKKTAELLEQNPELWRRYMDKSKSETSIFRDQLETLSHRHQAVRNLTKLTNANTQAEMEVDRLIEIHQQQIGASLVRTLDKAQTWLKADKAEKPAWLKSLESTAYLAIKNTTSVSDLNRGLDGAINDMIRGSKIDKSPSFAMRIGELKQARSESGLLEELIAAKETKNWQRGALLEQANIAHETQKLAGKIDLEGGRLDRLSDEVASNGAKLNQAFNEDLLPQLSNAVLHLQEMNPATLPDARSAQSSAVESYARCVKLLDSYVTAAIREMDKSPAKAGIGGGPKITAKTLEELERKLQDEKEKNDSFGIPCCRPTNLQVMSDWERVSQCSSGSSSPKPNSSEQSSKPESQPAQKPPSQESPSTPKPQEMEMANQPSESKPAGQPAGSPSEESGKSEPKESPSSKPGKGDKRSEVDAKSLADAKEKQDAEMAALAQAEALKQAKRFAEMLKSGEIPPESSSAESDSDIHGSGETEGVFTIGNVDLSGMRGPATEWNRLNSKLTHEILQEKSAQSMPDEYRDAIEAYFRSLSNWEGNLTE